MGAITTPSEYYVAFTGPQYVLTYLPASGTAAALSASDTNPNTTSAGIFAGDVTGLALNIDFNNAGLLGSTSSIPFGDLVLTNYTYDSALNGLTVNQLLAVANTCLAGGACPGSLDAVDDLTEQLNLSFEAGTPDAFAQDYLALPSSGTPTPTPEPSSLLLLAPALACIAFLQRRRILRI